MEYNRGYAELATAIIAQAAKDWHEIETKKSVLQGIPNCDDFSGANGARCYVAI